MRYSLVFLITSLALGQENFISPEVHGDARVTFRLLAPKAAEVTLRGEWMEGQVRAALVKDDQGLWSVTVGPLRPDLYSYSFTVDGLTISDPRNPVLKPGARSYSSLVDIPGPEVAFHALRPVPHGDLHIHHYSSAALGAVRRIHVYTPPGYASNPKQRYPVLYLLHGSGDTDAEWSSVGRAGWILDNLIAGGKAQPMLIVMPNGHATDARDRDPAARGQNTAKFEAELTGDIIPLVEKTYRVEARRERRALVGLSMGGMQSLNIGLAHLNLFSHIGVFSAGIGGRLGTVQDFENKFQAVLSKPEATNKQLALFWIGCGKTDFLFQSVQELIGTLKKNGVRHVYHESEGGHVWWNWRMYLAELAPLLFGGNRS